MQSSNRCVILDCSAVMKLRQSKTSYTGMWQYEYEVYAGWIPEDVITGIKQQNERINERIIYDGNDYGS